MLEITSGIVAASCTRESSRRLPPAVSLISVGAEGASNDRYGL
jgi:hypothetical protein